MRCGQNISSPALWVVLLVFGAAVAILKVWLTRAAGGKPADLGASSPVRDSKSPAGWKLVWSDDFSGVEIDAKKWNFDYGSFLQAGSEWLPGWGNNELEFYTRRPRNVFVKDGMLHIVARRENFKARQFTSARLTTHKLFAKRYGRFDIRARLPVGQGIWPAIWMRPEKDTYGPWAASGEIDMVEARGREPRKVLGTLHYGSRWPANVHSGQDFDFPDNGAIADFHVYSLEWRPGEMSWLVDGKRYQTQNFWWSCSDSDGPHGVEPADESELNTWPAPFDQPFYLILNVAVGGIFGGNPDASTPFPAEMLVNYVRVYDPVDGYAPAPPRGPGRFPFSKKWDQPP